MERDASICAAADVHIGPVKAGVDVLMDLFRSIVKAFSAFDGSMLDCSR